MAILSVASFASGTAISCLADRLPFNTARAELIGGLLLVLSLVTLGVGLSPFLH